MERPTPIRILEKDNNRLDDAEIARRAHVLLRRAASTTSGQTLQELLAHLSAKLDQEEVLLLESDAEETQA